MPANTPKGFPYPLGTDRVMDGDDSIHNLATQIDAACGVLASGVAVPNVTTGGTPASVAVTFPVGRFTATPVVVAFANTSNPNSFQASAQSPSTTGVTIWGWRATAGTINAAWIAHQM